jgi:hypothetical protein
MSEQSRTDATNDFDAELAAVERFISDVQQGSVPTGEAMRAYRDVHRPAIERLRAQLTEFESLLADTGLAEGSVRGGVPVASTDGQAVGSEGEPESGSSGSA